MPAEKKEHLFFLLWGSHIFVQDEILYVTPTLRILGKEWDKMWEKNIYYVCSWCGSFMQSSLKIVFYFGLNKQSIKIVTFLSKQ